MNVAYPDTVVVEGTLSFDIGAGALVAGNTFTINTDSTGSADPLSFTPSGKANSILDTYKFTVTSGGEIGTDTVDIKWSNSVTSGTINITAAGDYTVDGMTVDFASGTLFDDDVFTITTNASGTPTSNLPSSWHWTLDSFTDQFNRQTSYVTASKTADNALKFDPTASDNELKNYSYSGSDGFFGSNITITVNNYEALTRTGTDFQLERDDVAYAATGDWGVPAATNPGYAVTLTALDGSDLDNGFYVELDGVRALTVTFDTLITSNGYVEFDIATASGDYSFGFSDDEAQDSVLMAALGINTFFKGSTAGGIAVSDTIARSKDYIAVAQIDSDTGDFAVGDNTNALAIAGLQYTPSNIAQWTCNRASAKSSANVTATVEGYYHSTVGSIGIKSASISRSKAFNEVMVNKLGEIRDSISAVSLDEEMINIIKFQRAYAAAAKLISVSDEMLNTLLSIK
jgi:flagellar hook-associated protein 1 FlgK